MRHFGYNQPTQGGLMNDNNEYKVADDWYEDGDEQIDDYQITEYEITASPNDFNIKTIFDFIESGSVKIPGFQRNYVWDQKRASKLIESILIGLPVPQVFLYEESRNNFLVIDGQQRLMSIYYFIKQRFPRKDKRSILRAVFDEHGRIPEEVLHDDEYFSKFNLQLAEKVSGQPNRFKKMNYGTLGDYKSTFDLRTIRNVIIKQNFPEGEDSSIYEIFNRLNSGGINLKPQEIRTSLYHSLFYEMISRTNSDAKWRKIVGLSSPDLHMKDVEIILRGFAMLIEGDQYNPSMTKFLNGFSKNSKALSADQISYLEELFHSFVAACSDMHEKSFYSKQNRFNVLLYESVFAAVCSGPFKSRELVKNAITQLKFNNLKDDPKFIAATQTDTASKINVNARLDRALTLLS